MYSGHPRFIRDNGNCIPDALVFARTSTVVIRDTGFHVRPLVVDIRHNGRYFQDTYTDVIRDTGLCIQDTDGVFQDTPVWLRMCQELNVILNVLRVLLKS